MNDPKEGDFVTVKGRTETNWRWFRGNGPKMVECYRITAQGRKEFRVFKAEDVQLNTDF